MKTVLARTFAYWVLVLFICFIIARLTTKTSTAQIVSSPTIQLNNLNTSVTSKVIDLPTKVPESCWRVDEDRYIHASLTLIEENDGYICSRCEEFIPKRYGFTEDDIYLLAQLLCGDSVTDGDGEYDIDYQEEINYKELSKVLCVVMNRQRDDRFPDTVKEIVLAKNQFSVFPNNLDSIPSEKALENIRDWCDSYDKHDDGVQCIPEDHIYFNGDGVSNTTRS